MVWACEGGRCKGGGREEGLREDVWIEPEVMSVLRGSVRPCYMYGGVCHRTMTLHKSRNKTKKKTKASRRVYFQN